VSCSPHSRTPAITFAKKHLKDRKLQNNPLPSVKPYPILSHTPRRRPTPATAPVPRFAARLFSLLHPSPLSSPRSRAPWAIALILLGASGRLGWLVSDGLLPFGSNEGRGCGGSGWWCHLSPPPHRSAPPLQIRRGRGSQQRPAGRAASRSGSFSPCAGSVEKAVKRLPGIHAAAIDVLDSRAQVVFYPGFILMRAVLLTSVPMQRWI
jgi:hypothetical protein